MLFSGGRYLQGGDDHEDVLVYVLPDGAGQEWHFVMRPRASLAGAWIREDRLVYATQVYDQVDGALDVTFRSLPLTAPQNSPPVELYHGRLPGTSDFHSFPCGVGAAFLACVTPGGTALLRSYDGTVELPLALDVTNFFRADLWAAR